MHLQITRPNKHRHVVFTSPAGSAGRVVNLTPQPLEPPAHRRQPPQLTEEEESFVRSLFARAGINADAYRQESLRRRLKACLRAVRATSIPDARRQLARNSPRLLRPSRSWSRLACLTFSDR